MIKPLAQGAACAALLFAGAAICTLMVATQLYFALRAALQKRRPAPSLQTSQA